MAERVVIGLIDGEQALLEDRVDDFVKQYGPKIPGDTPQAKRATLERWMHADPSYVAPRQLPDGRTASARGGKYFPWMLREFAKGRVKWTNAQLDAIHDDFMEFERLLALPAFDKPRDVLQYPYKDFVATVEAHRGLASRTQVQRQEREKKKALYQPTQNRKGVKVASEAGNISVLQITNSDSLSWWAWKAYSADNPNWKYPPNDPSMSPEQIKQLPPWNHINSYGPWCVRGTSFGDNYMRNEPDKSFYMVLKNGGPLVGILLTNGQAKDLQNHGINMGVAEEIYPAMKPIIDSHKQNGGRLGSECQVFDNLRIVRGELQPGETIGGGHGTLDLSGSTLSALPDRLTVSCGLDISGTRMASLPTNMTVNGDLNISGTAISELPPGLKVTGALILAGTRISALPQGMSVGTLDISGTPIAQLPEDLKVGTKLKIQGTSITRLPDTLKLEKGASVEYSAPLSREEIKRFFFWLRAADLKIMFFKEPANNKYTTPEQKEAAWKAFVPKLQGHFQKDPTVDKAVASLFKPHDTRR